MDQISCSKCGQVFEGRCAVGNKNKHEKKCAGPKYECRACISPQTNRARVFTNFRAFNRHLKTHEQKAQRVVAICNNCSLNFETKKQLEEHKRTKGHKKRTSGEEESITEYENVTIAVCTSRKRKNRTREKEVRELKKKRAKMKKTANADTENQEEEAQENEQIGTPLFAPMTPATAYLFEQFGEDPFVELESENLNWEGNQE